MGELKTKFESGKSNTVAVITSECGRWVVAVEDCEARAIVAWMENREEIKRVLRMARDLEVGEGYSPISLINTAAQVLAAAVPDESDEESHH